MLSGQRHFWASDKLLNFRHEKVIIKTVKEYFSVYPLRLQLGLLIQAPLVKYTEWVETLVPSAMIDK